ncbi:hypothetical protein ACHAP8_009527 [Fusarium lateritium]
MSGLEGLGIVANVIAVAELSLKVIAWCSKYAQDVKNSHDGRARLLQATITLHYESDKVRELLSSKKGSKLRASQRLYSSTIGSSEIQLRELEHQLSRKGNYRSNLKWPLQKEKVENAIRHIEKSTKTMQSMLQIDMADLLVGIDDRAEAEEQRAAIDQLPYVCDAVWNSHIEERNAKCLPNTREKLLEEVEVWIKDTAQQSKTMFWLNGMAGTGKSTISRTISQFLSQDGRMGATFFFKRGEADRGGISKLVSTIARQLAMNQPRLKPYIHAAIRDDPTIINKADPLFIFAATACRFISERQLGSPEKQLRRFLEYQTEGTTSQLDFTYRPVLTQLFSSSCSKASDRRVILEFRRVIGTLINLLDPLSASALSRLLDMDQDIIDSKLDLLHSVLDVPLASELPIRMLHLSFRDYLMSPEIRAHQFWIDEKKSASYLAKDCLRVMKTLRPDICLLKIPGTRRSTLKPDFINACMPPEVQYACLYWVYHQVVAGLGPGDATRILKFLKQHLLHWVEAMSLLGRAFQITKLMGELQSAIPIKSTGDEPDLTNFLNDAMRFVDIDIQTVNLEPLQIYCSLLVLAPSNSLVKQMFAAETPTWVSLLSGQVTNWDLHLRLLGDTRDPIDHYNSMVFLPDSESLCFISSNGHLHVWNGDTGECIHDIKPEPEKSLPITAQDAPKYFLPTVSPDGKLVAVKLTQ